MWSLGWVDRLNYSWTHNFVMIVWILLGIVWLFKGSTTCSHPSRSTVSVDSCLKNLYYVGPHDKFDPRHLANYKKVDTYKDINWFSVYVALVYLSPFVLWFFTIGDAKWHKLSKKIKQLDKATISSDLLDDETITDMAEELLDIRYSFQINYPASFYLFLRLANAGLTLLVLYTISSFAEGDFFWPLDSSASTLFPSKTTCYERSWSYHTPTEFTTCTHPMAGWYHFAFVIQWIWFAVATIVNFVDLISTFNYWNNPEKYERVIRESLVTEKEEVVDDFLESIGEEGIVLFTILYHNCQSNVVDSLLGHVLKEYKLRSTSNNAEDMV